ncbi:hypothetical protein CEUSTIGMA_g10504.t1 [Chlamydomonas eustigma]|uniref:S-acyltransferase n=1 Tax=Chlamydomonas eustigma TaxID=1157962 RepID=A0A250XJ26_9CHLO|nr:hypothetical protein CEUSTIGMA_g10504.t1 [Chlamydomonas eustigma]|eukprot:GAX83078.1 hypothetical protein CEUSTIGMA_g10504.t1 [Chlamydomonas eustigma]
MSHEPKLPERSKRRHVASSERQEINQNVTIPHVPPYVDIVREKAEALLSNPVLSRLMEDPSALQAAIKKDPMLQALISSNPNMAQLLQPERMTNVLQAMRDPRLIMSGQAVPAGDVSSQRMMLIKLQEYRAQLSQQMLQRQQQQQLSENLQSNSLLTDNSVHQSYHIQQISHANVANSAINNYTPSTNYMHAPLQSASFFSGSGLPHQEGTSRPMETQGKEYEGSFTFSHSVREVPLHHLGEEAQGVLRAASHEQTHFGSAGGEQVGSSWQPSYLNSSQPLPGSFGHGHEGQLQGFNGTAAGPVSQYQQQQGGGPLLRGASHYEDVAPSNWRPDEEDLGDDFLGLYRRAYCTFGDALWPPIWLSLSAVLLELTSISLWILIPVLIVTFLGGVYVFAVLLAGVLPKHLPLSRTMPSFIASLELITAVVYFYWLAPKWIGALSGLGIMLGLALAALAPLHLWVAVSDPGFIEKPVACEDPERQGFLKQVAVRPDSCPMCAVEKPLRSKHCLICKRCVRRFDHHCPASGNCIGEKNQRVFVCYIVVMLIAQISLITACSSFLKQLYYADSESGNASHAVEGWPVLVQALALASVQNRGVLMMALVQIPFTVLSSYLLLRGLWCVAANLTVIELIKRKETPYLNHELAGYCNRFDRGALSNCLQFWVYPSQDWWAEYEKGDRDMVSRGVTLPTYISPGTIFRALDMWQKRRAVSKAAWEQKRLLTALKDLGVDEAGATVAASKFGAPAAAVAMSGGSCSSGACRHAH